MKKDGSEDVVFVLGLLLIALYFFVVLSCLDSLGRLDLEIKKMVYKHYNIPLPSKDEK